MPSGFHCVKCQAASGACIRMTPYDTRASTTAFAQHDTHQVGRVLGAEFFHDACTMHLDGARADAKLASRLLVGETGGDLPKHIALARGELVVAGELAQRHAAVSVTPRPGFYRFTDVCYQRRRIERLLDEIERTVLDRFDRHWDIAGARDDKDRRGVMLRVEFFQDVEPGASRHLNVENDAS